MWKFVIDKAKNWQFYFVLKASNGQIIAQSEMYKSKASCEHWIESVRKHAPEAELQDKT